MHVLHQRPPLLVPPWPMFPQAPRFIPDGRISRVRLATMAFPLTAFPYKAEA